MSRPDLSVVVVHHLGVRHLLECLAGLERGRGGLAVETLLVDNTGGFDLSEVLRRHPAVRLVPAPGNVGFARGCRLGSEAAGSPAVVFVNDDAVVEPEALPLLAATLAAAPADVAAVAGRLVDRSGARSDFSDGFLTFDGHAFASDVGHPVERLRPVESGEERLFASGGLMAVRRETFLYSGAFDDDYFAYLEDVDFGWRQWILGSRIVAEPRAVARHRGGATAEALGVFARGFLFERNAFSTAFKNFDQEHFRALMPAVFAAFLGRLAAMLSTRNPGAAVLARDPYASVPRRLAIARLFGISPPPDRAVVDDPLTIAQGRALLWISENHEALARKRRAVQAARRRPDREIFAKFPLRIVPTYPGDEWFGSDFFREILEAGPALVPTTLAEIFERAS